MPQADFLPLIGPSDHVPFECLPESPEMTVEQARMAMKKFQFLESPADHTALPELADAFEQMARVDSSGDECRAEDMDEFGWMIERVEELDRPFH